MKTMYPLMLAACLLLAACGPRQSEETTSDATTETPATDSQDDASDATTADAGASTPAESTPAATEPAVSSASASATTFVDAQGRTVYTFAEVPPAFEGGENELNKYLRRNLKYPATDEEGTIFVSFVVGADGAVRDSKVESGAPDQKLRDEALRVVTAMPKWTAGKQGGKPVHVKFTLPVTFKKQV
jgi:TonB family protein